MKHPPSSLWLVMQVSLILFITLAVVWFFFRLRPSILPVPTLQETLHTVSESVSPAVAIIFRGDVIVGTGVLIDEYTVLTSKHSLQWDESYLLQFPDGTRTQSTILSVHPHLDLALLKLSKPHSSPLTLITSQALVRPGDFVLAGGTLLWSKTPINHLGIVSWLEQNMSPEISGMILTDIPFRSGYSGWPLVNLRAELIGINTAYSTNESAWWSTPVDRTLITDWQAAINDV